MIFGNILQNHVLLTGLAGWLLAQILKIPIGFLRTHRWNWLVFWSGWNASSHSSLITSTAAAVGLYYGFDSPVFGVATAIAMIVVYDATGIRRQAGMQAQKINILVEELLKGHPISDKHLREVLGIPRWKRQVGYIGPGSRAGPVVRLAIK